MNKEIFFVLFIIGILLAVFSIIAYEYQVSFEANKDQKIQMTELFGNGTVRNFEIDPPGPPPNIFTIIGITVLRFAHALPFVIAGIVLIGMPIGLLQNQFVVPPEGFNVLIFWILAMVSIPLTYYFSKSIVRWRRVLYIYFIAAIISGMPILLNRNFGG